MSYLLVKQLGDGTKRSEQEGINIWESWLSPEDSIVLMLKSIQ